MKEEKCFCFFLFFIFCLFNNIYSLNIIVGDVSTNEARLLYFLSSNNNNSESYYENNEICSLSLFPPVSSATLLLIKPLPEPQIIELSYLHPDQSYIVQFYCGNNKMESLSSLTDSAFFHTLPINNNYPASLYYLSCNRLSEEYDNEMWDMVKYEIASNYQISNELPIIFYHLGDQIYADNVIKNINNKYKKDNNICITYHDIIKEFRDIYSLTWDNDLLKPILRNNSHRMLLDDHDIINNFNILKWDNTDILKKSIIRAGLQTYFEYQYQLINSIPSFDFIKTSKEASCCILSNSNTNICQTSQWDEFDNKLYSIKLWNIKRIGNTFIITLDSRYEHSLHSNILLFSKEQLQYVKDQLVYANSDESIHSIIITLSIPIIYQSSFMSQIAYWFESEQYSTHPSLIENTGELLDILFQYPNKITIVAGDIHMYLNSVICRDEDNICIPQIISSGMTSKSSTIRSWHLYLYSFFAIQVFTPKVITNNGSYYLYTSKVFLDNSFIRYSFDEWNGNWEVFEREMDLILRVLQRLFEQPLAYFFVLFCIASNILFIFFIGCIFCCPISILKSKDKKEKKE